MRIMLVVGERANWMKVTPLYRAIHRHNESHHALISPILVAIGKSYRRFESEEQFFDDLNLPKPDISLDPGTGHQEGGSGDVAYAFDQVLQTFKPGFVLIVGDFNWALACTLTARKQKIPVGHIDAGFRTGDLDMPEETERRFADFLSDYLFTSDSGAVDNLIREGFQEERIYPVGNIQVDVLFSYLAKAAFSPVLNRFDLREGLEVRPFGVVSLHRFSNIDHYQTFRNICEALFEVSKSLPLIFACTPHMEERIRSYGLEHLFGRSLLHEDRIIITQPLGHLDSLHLNAHARLILTDSGFIQEEATIMGVPCLTLRDTTDRPITLTQGTNRLVGTESESIMEGFRMTMSDPERLYKKPELWDGMAAERIVRILSEIDKKKRESEEEEVLAVPSWF